MDNPLTGHGSSDSQSGSRAFMVAQQAVNAVGCGYDVTYDLYFGHCKSQRLIQDVDDTSTHELHLPNSIVLQNVPTSITCDKGERARFTTDVLTFNEMSLQFNKRLGISEKIPLGHFNATFDLSGSWQKDASSINRLAMDGIFVNLYNVELSRTQLRLKQEVIDAVPPSYDPIALGSFVEKYGTHIITGVRIGGKDVICIKQDNSSSLSPTAVQKYLEVKSKERFSSAGNTSQENTNKGKSGLHQALQFDSSINSSTTESNGLTLISRRKGGQLSSGSHDKWLHTVSSDPSIVSMSFVSIASLLSRVPGSGFLTQAINLYLRYKPPIQELDQFLEFQLPKEWAPAYGHLPLAPPRKQQASPSLQFRPLGPKLQVNTTPVVLGKQCVTGMRLHLEGRKRNVLAIHLQHLKAVPQRLERMWKDDQPEIWEGPGVDFMKYFEPVMWKSFSHVCTAPIESIDAWDEGESRYALIVTGAQLEVEEHGSKKVLFLRLLYSKVHGVSIRRSEWDYTPTSNSKSGIFSTLIAFSGALTTPPKPQMVNINSGICPKDPPTNSQTPKLLKLVDTSEMARGPVHSPGHWIVTGAKLSVDSGKICVHVKYSLLSHVID